jgi:hypothetical protein
MFIIIQWRVAFDLRLLGSVLLIYDDYDYDDVQYINSDVRILFFFFFFFSNDWGIV